MSFKITYSVLNADLSALHKEFDQALENVRSKLGQEYPSWIGGKEFRSGQFLNNINPANTNECLAKFHQTPVSEIDRVVEIAKNAQKSWGKTPWQERAKLLRKAADLISERRLEISARMSLEVGKSRLESLGDVEESADLFRYYAGQLEDSNGFLKPLAKLSPNEDTRSVLRPYGVFTVIAPFNFPLALSAGMSGAALLGGNTVILKPSQDTPWSAHDLYLCIRDAGIPEGVFQVVYGDGPGLGEALVKHPKMDGIVFTGSKEVGMRIFHHFSTNFVKPCFLELGGKNPCIVTQSADLDMAAEGAARSAFGLTGQKCSALSRIYIHESVYDSFLSKLKEKASGFKIGDPVLKDTFMGPIINERAYKRHLSAIESAKKDGKILFGGKDLKINAEYSKGWFVDPTIAEVPIHHSLFSTELFAPFLTVQKYQKFDDAVRHCNEVDYGLTGGIFSQDKNELDQFMQEVESGVLYANRRTGATTGAWPGVQAFCGWKGSGSTGKGGCGPYYVSQFMREQSQTRML